MTFITLLTVGFSEVEWLSDAGRFFTMFIGLANIDIVAFIATRLAQLSYVHSSPLWETRAARSS